MYYPQASSHTPRELNSSTRYALRFAYFDRSEFSSEPRVSAARLAPRRRTYLISVSSLLPHSTCSQGRYTGIALVRVVASLAFAPLSSLERRFSTADTYKRVLRASPIALGASAVHLRHQPVRRLSACRTAGRNPTACIRRSADWYAASSERRGRHFTCY